MSERSTLISKLLRNTNTRTAYIKAKLGIVVPSQIRALRLKSDMPRQADLAAAADMQQSRISMFETPGAANVTLETLARLAAVFKVGLVVKFVPFSEMLLWENTFSQDEFNVLRLNEDTRFLAPVAQNIPDLAMASVPYLHRQYLSFQSDQFAPKTETRIIDTMPSQHFQVAGNG